MNTTSCQPAQHHATASATTKTEVPQVWTKHQAAQPIPPLQRPAQEKSRSNFLLTFAPSSHQFKIGPLRFRYGYLYWTYNSTALPSVLAGSTYGTSFACASSNRRKARREKSLSSKKLACRKVQHSPKRNSPGHDSCRWSFPGTMPAGAQSRLAATGTNWLLSCF